MAAKENPFSGQPSAAPRTGGLERSRVEYENWYQSKYEVLGSTIDRLVLISESGAYLRLRLPRLGRRSRQSAGQPGLMGSAWPEVNGQRRLQHCSTAAETNSERGDRTARVLPRASAEAAAAAATAAGARAAGTSPHHGGLECMALLASTAVCAPVWVRFRWVPNVPRCPSFSAPNGCWGYFASSLNTETLLLLSIDTAPLEACYLLVVYRVIVLLPGATFTPHSLTLTERGLRRRLCYTAEFPLATGARSAAVTPHQQNTLANDKTMSRCNFRLSACSRVNLPRAIKLNFNWE